jgi:hypothetical protein
MPKPDPRAKLPRLAPRRQTRKRAPKPVAKPAPSPWQPVLDVLHKMLTAGAALATILRLLF